MILARWAKTWVAAKDGSHLPPAWLFALAIPLSMLGTVVGGRILDKLTDINFKRYTRLIVTAVGIMYLVQAGQLFLSGQ